MFYLLIVLFIVIVSIILRIAAATGLALPLIYGLVAPTLFSEWFHANQQLGEGIGWALLVIVGACLDCFPYPQNYWNCSSAPCGQGFQAGIYISAAAG